MFPKYSTPIPNVIFDTYLPKLRPAELILLLIILRQTVGWFDVKTKKRKTRDLLSGSQLRQKTGLSRKSISTALERLYQLQLIKAYSCFGEELKTPEQRRGKTQIYYSFSEARPVDITNIFINKQELLKKTCELNTHDMRNFYAQQKKLLQKKLIYQ